MSGAKLGTNATKTPFGCNQTRPGGADALATSRDADALLLAIATGNRQTRRLARQNLQKMQRQAAVSAGRR